MWIYNNKKFKFTRNNRGTNHKIKALLHQAANINGINNIDSKGLNYPKQVKKLTFLTSIYSPIIK